MKRSRVFLKPLSSIALILGLISLLIPGSMAINANDSLAQEQPPAVSQEILWNFIQAEDALSSNLTRVDTALSNASSALSEVGLQGPEAQAILANLCTADPAQINCVTVSPNGSILEVEPGKYSYLKGIDISHQEQIKKLFATKHPVGMTYIKTVQGFYAVDFAASVFDEAGCVIGATTILINTTEFFGRIPAPYQPDSGAKI